MLRSTQPLIGCPPLAPQAVRGRGPRSGRVRGTRLIFNAFERMVAFRYLRARRQEGFVSVIAIFSLLGIALGVATLIIVMSVMNGFRAELIGRILGLNGHLAVYGETTQLKDFDATAAVVRQVPGVVSATPLVEGQVMATGENGAAGALVRGIRPDDIRARKLIADHIVAGSLAEFGDDGVAIGDRLARRLGLGVGGRVTLIAPVPSGVRSPPRSGGGAASSIGSTPIRASSMRSRSSAPSCS